MNSFQPFVTVANEVRVAHSLRIRMSELTHAVAEQPQNFAPQIARKTPIAFLQLKIHLWRNTCDVYLQMLHHRVRVGRRADWPYCTFPDDL